MRLELRLRLNEHRWGALVARDDDEDAADLDEIERAVLPAYLRNEALPRYLEQWPEDPPARSWLRLLRDSEEW